MKPFWPLALPWQPPELQPSLVKIGTIWLAKLIGRFTSQLTAVTGMVSDLVAVDGLDLGRAVGRPAGRGRSRVTRATFSSATSYFTSPVRSCKSAAGEAGGDDELLGVVGVLQGDLVRMDGERLHIGGLGQDERLQFGTVLVAVEVSGGEKTDGPDQGRDGQQSGPAKAFHGWLPPKRREA